MNARAHNITSSLLPVLLLLLLAFSTNAFLFGGRAVDSGCPSCRLHSSISLDDERLPSGAFGITRPQAVVTTRDTYVQIEPSSLIPFCGKPVSPPTESISYNKDLDLPHSSLPYESDPSYATLAAVELSFSRIAMIASLFLFSVEVTTGTSVLDQIISMIG